MIEEGDTVVLKHDIEIFEGEVVPAGTEVLVHRVYRGDDDELSVSTPSRRDLRFLVRTDEVETRA